MKRSSTLFFVITMLTFSAFGQESLEKTMEKRAREFHRTIGLTDKEQWKKFVKENYSQAFIDKPMKGKIEESTGSGTSSVETKSMDNLEGKAMMFERLHDDFGGSKIVSITPAGESLKMVLENDEGLRGTFQIKYGKLKPYLIEGLGIEVGN